MEVDNPSAAARGARQRRGSVLNAITEAVSAPQEGSGSFSNKEAEPQEAGGSGSASFTEDVANPSVAARGARQRRGSVLNAITESVSAPPGPSVPPPGLEPEQQGRRRSQTVINPAAGAPDELVPRRRSVAVLGSLSNFQHSSSTRRNSSSVPEDDVAAMMAEAGAEGLGADSFARGAGGRRSSHTTGVPAPAPLARPQRLGRRESTIN